MVPPLLPPSSQTTSSCLIALVAALVLFVMYLLKPDLLQTDDLIVFKDRSPAAKLHLLVIPRKHIGTVKDMKKKDIPLLQDMIGLGEQLLKDHGYQVNDNKERYRLGFHVPPFNSVNHLHMHVIGLDFKNEWRKWKYMPGRIWYLDASSLLAQLHETKS